MASSMAMVLAVLALVSQSFMVEAGHCYNIDNCKDCADDTGGDKCAWCGGFCVLKTDLKTQCIKTASLKSSECGDDKKVKRESLDSKAVADASAVLHVSWMALLVVPLALGVMA